MNTISDQTIGTGHGITGYNVPVPGEIHEATDALIRIARQKPNDPEAQRRAKAAIGLYCRNFGTQRSSELRVEDSSDCLVESSRFPLEIYELIISHLAMSQERYHSAHNVVVGEALSALSRSSRFLQALVEPYLYKYPRREELHDYESQYLLRFSLAVEPRRASLVQTLDFSWGRCPNTRRVQIDTALACPSLHTLSLSVSEHPNEAESHQVSKDLSELFAACPNVKSFMVHFVSFGSQDYPRPSDEEKAAKFAQQLTLVEVWGLPKWFYQVLLPNLSPNLTSLSVIRASHLTSFEEPDLLPVLCNRCPVLKKLTMHCRFTTVQALVDACIAWGPTLEYLWVDSFESDTGIVSQFFPHMQTLRELFLGPCFSVHIDDIIAIARSQTCLKSFTSESPDLRPNDDFSQTASPELNCYMAEMLTAHASTLQTVWLGGRFRLDRDVFESLKQVKHLECVNLGWEKGLELKDIDDFLSACPNVSERKYIKQRALAVAEPGDGQSDGVPEIDKLTTANLIEKLYGRFFCWQGSWAVTLKPPSG